MTVELGKGMPIALVSAVQKITSHKSPDFVEMHNMCYSQFGDPSAPAEEVNSSLTGDMMRREQITQQFLHMHDMCTKGESVSQEEGPVQVTLSRC